MPPQPASDGGRRRPAEGLLHPRLGDARHASAMRVDYDYIAINGHDYLLPTRATIAVLRHKHEGVLNEIQFRDYRRFGAKARMVPMNQ